MELDFILNWIRLQFCLEKSYLKVLEIQNNNLQIRWKVPEKTLKVLEPWPKVLLKIKNRTTLAWTPSKFNDQIHLIDGWSFPSLEKKFEEKGTILKRFLSFWSFHFIKIVNMRWIHNWVCYNFM